MCFRVLLNLINQGKTETMIGVFLFFSTFAFMSSQGQDTSRQQQIEDKWEFEMHMIDEMINSFDRKNIKQTLRYLSEEPHIAASPRDNELAEYIRDKFEEAGFDSSELVPYNIYLSRPNPENPNKIILDTNGETIFESHFIEIPIDEEIDPNFVHAFNAYTPAGTVSTEPGVGVIYVNYGREEDYEKLLGLGINIKGHIAIARYGLTSRGSRVQSAEKFGAKGLIFFSDPEDVAAEGITPENVYDHTWWIPGTGIQRGSAKSGGRGDVLTPGWPSTEHAYRLSEDEAKLPKIPAQPIGYSDAFQILKRLDGPTAPEDWQGGYPNFKYKLGPFFNDQSASVSLTLSTHNSGKVEKSYNVIGIIKGCIEPDRYVLIGNHRDAWGYGAVDPSSGTAAILETARVLGIFLKKGWKPRRTIVFCSWGAEEDGLIGATEWIEENIDKLQSRAVGYLNSDYCTTGPELVIAASPLLQDLFLNVTKLIPGVKDSYKTLFDEWREYGERLRPSAKEHPIISNLDSTFGTDHTYFSFHAGVPSANIIFSKDEIKYNISILYPSYHTAYETFNMVETFIDPGFKIHEGCGRLFLLSLKLLADSSVLPYSLGRLPSIMLSNLQNNKNRKRLIQIYDKYTELENSVKKFGVSVFKFENMIKSSTFLSELQLRAINDQMMKLEQIFIIPEGLPGRPYLRSAIFAPGSSYFSTKSNGFPGLSYLLSDFDSLNQTEQQARTKLIKRHISDLTIMTDRAAAFLEDVHLI